MYRVTYDHAMSLNKNIDSFYISNIVPTNVEGSKKLSNVKAPLLISNGWKANGKNSHSKYRRRSEAQHDEKTEAKVCLRNYFVSFYKVYKESCET